MLIAHLDTRRSCSCCLPELRRIGYVCDAPLMELAAKLFLADLTHMRGYQNHVPLSGVGDDNNRSGRLQLGYSIYAHFLIDTVVTSQSELPCVINTVATPSHVLVSTVRPASNPPTN